VGHTATQQAGSGGRTATEHRLDNGLTVWVFDLPGQYVISATMAIEPDRKISS